MGNPQLGSRLARFQALRLATKAFPALKRRMPFFSGVRGVLDAGVVVEEFDEQQDIALTPEEAELAARLPNPPPARLSRQIALVRLENVTVLGNTGKLIDEREGVLLRTRMESPRVEVNDFRAETTRPVDMPAANYFYFMGEHSGHAHLYHFLFERLPRLFYLLERFSTGREPLVVLTNQNPPAFQRDIFGFAEARYPTLKFRQIPRNERWRLPHAYVVDDCNTIGRPTGLAPETLAFIRALIVDGYGLNPAQAHRRLYVNRGDARKRRLLNEAELWPLFAAKGFESVSAARLSFREQVALFSEASAIAGPHGAGLSHILFAPGVKTLELFPADKAFYLAYFDLTHGVGGTYNAVIGTRGNRLGHFRVNPADVERALDAMTTPEER